MPFLDWVNKNQAKESSGAVPYHLLHHESSHGDASAENMLIQGDNLLALRALKPFYGGQVKCVFIDPPYNTKSAFAHYDDKLEHSQWLSMMYPRLVLLRDLLAEDGSIWVTVDDNEAHYLKVLMDEVFGRQNFVANVVWKKKHTRQNDARWFSDNHDHALIFAKNKNSWTLNRLPRTEEMNQRFSNPDNDPRGDWSSQPLQVKTPSKSGIFKITTPSGREVFPPAGRSWMCSEEGYKELLEDNRIYFGENGSNVPRVKKFITEVKGGLVPVTIWLNDEVGHNQEAKREVKDFNREDVFDTPKPERLLQRILHIATNPGDLVLDSFLGSGTTAAVAHKMGRRYIGIEMGEHARTHCLPRLEKVIEGEQGGISQAVEWQGGGGFRFYTLGGAAFDASGRISEGVKFPILAAYLWHQDTGKPAAQDFDTPFLGVHDGVAYYLLFNGILGDRRPEGGNVLTHAVLQSIREQSGHDGPSVIYGEVSHIGPARMAQEGITFKQIPYDIDMR